MKLCKKSSFGASCQIIIWGCVKRFLLTLRAKFYLDRHMISTISRSEIVEIMCLSKENFAAEGGKRLFTQPHNPKLLKKFIFQ